MAEKTIPTTVNRQKYWSELMVDKRVERMRIIIKRLQEDVRRMEKIYWDFRSHKHNKDGEPIIIKRLGYNIDEVSERKPEQPNDDIYF